MNIIRGLYYLCKNHLMKSLLNFGMQNICVMENAKAASYYGNGRQKYF